MSYGLGIDLGTTFSAAAIARDGRAETFSLGSQRPVIPSVIFLKEDETILVGESAIRRASAEPGRVAREFKRRIGDPTPILLGGSPYSAEALMAKLLRWIVDTVVEREGGPPSEVAVSHPANWGPYKLDLLTQAVRLAELRVDRYIAEPEAAAIAYAVTERVETGTVVAVYDLGGGTFDAAVLHTTSTGFEIIGEPEGIERLGGVDFDQALIAHVAASLNGAIESLDPQDPSTLAALARLRQECVDAKEALSTDSDTSVPVFLPNMHTEVRVTRAEFESMIRPPLSDTVAALRRAVRSAGVIAEDVGAVLLVGGSSRIPLVAELVGHELARPVAVDAHPKHVVAIGAALAASNAPVHAVAAHPAPLVPPVPGGPDGNGGSSVHVLVAAPVAAREDESPHPEVEPAAKPSPARVPPPPSPSPSPPAGPRRKGRHTVIAAVVAAVVIVAGVVGAVAFTRDDSSSSGIAVPPGATVCPTPGTPAVCITAIQFDGNKLLADFQAQDAQIANPTGGTFPAGTVHPVFFFDTLPASSGRPWGSNSPFGGPSDAGLQGFTTGDARGATALCALLQDDVGRVTAGSGNCAPLPQN